MKRYCLINLTCVILSAGFLFGTIYVWRGENEEDYADEDYKIERLEDYSNTGNNLSVFQSYNSSTSITSTAEQLQPPLPTAKLLSVPFTSQAPEKNWEQPWQDACEEAAILMLDAYYKKYNLSPLFAKDEILKMIDLEEKLGWGTSIEIEKVKELVERIVLLNHLITASPHHVRIVENPTIDDIKKFIANGQPVLVVADGKVLPNPHFRNDGPVYHALIIRGYTETEFITNDPGTQFGRGFKYKYEDLLNAIHDWNGGDVKNGKKVILVVE